MEINEASFQIVAELLATHTGQQLTEDRRWRIPTTLSGVYRQYGVDNLEQLTCLLGSEQGDVLEQDIVEALLNHETYFYRDKPTFEQLPKDILPELAQKRAAAKKLRIWCAGCSTGQEVYSLAMEFVRNPAQWAGWRIDLLGTDISEKAINKACTGIYSQFEVQRGLGIAQMLEAFDETHDGWLLKKPIREMAQFKRHNFLRGTPSNMRFDLVLCRNVLLYFDESTRSFAFDQLSAALAADGYLMLGAGETVVGRTSQFVPSHDRPSVFEPNGAPHSPAEAAA